MNVVINIKPIGNSHFTPCLSNARPAIGAATHESKIAGKSASDEISVDSPLTPKNSGIIIFSAKTKIKPIILMQTDNVNALFLSGAKLMSGSTIFFCLQTNNAIHAQPTAIAMSAIHQLVNTYDSANNMPTNASPIKMTDKMSSFGFESSAILPRKNNPKIKQTAQSAPNVQNKTCQLPPVASSKTPESNMLIDGPKVVIIAIKPIYEPSFSRGATCSATFIASGTSKPEPSD